MVPDKLEKLYCPDVSCTKHAKSPINVARNVKGLKDEMTISARRSHISTFELKTLL